MEMLSTGVFDLPFNVSINIITATKLGFFEWGEKDETKKHTYCCFHLFFSPLL